MNEWHSCALKVAQREEALLRYLMHCMHQALVAGRRLTKHMYASDILENVQIRNIMRRGLVIWKDSTRSQSLGGLAMAKLEKISMKNADAPKLKTLLTDIGRESKALRRVMTRLQIRDVLQVFKRWTDQTVAEKQMQASSFKAVHRLNAAKIWHSFYIWLEHAAEELTKLKIITIVRRLLVKRLLSRALHQSFDLWLFHIFETQQHTAEALKELSRKIHFAAKLVKVRSNATCLQALRLWYEHTKSKLLSSAELVNRWTNNTQALAWGKWRGQVRRSRVAKKLVMWWIEKKLFAAWKTWERQVEKKHRCKLLARAADKIEVRCNKVHLAKVVAWWKDNIKKLRHKGEALEKMVLRMQSVGMCKAFALWIDNATKLRRLWSLLQKMSLRMRSAGMCKGWVRWEEQWRQGKKMRRSAEKVIKRLQNTSLAPAFLALMESAKELKGMRNARARVIKSEANGQCGRKDCVEAEAPRNQPSHVAVDAVRVRQNPDGSECRKGSASDAEDERWDGVSGGERYDAAEWSKRWR